MKIKSILTLVLVFCAIVSCDEEKLNPVNPNQLSTETFYRTGAQAQAAVNAAYAALQANNLYNREHFFLHDLLSDDVESGGAQLEGPRAQVLNYVFDASNPVVESVWRGWSRVMHFSKLVLESVPSADQEITGELKSRILGEAYFLRALANFELVSLWGGIPLMTASATSPESLPRSSEDQVYQQIFSDLGEAENRLPLKSAYSGADVGRASKGAAQALAAKVHLFRGNYAEAKTFLEKVISSNQYRLVARYLDNFEEENENNEESIWEVQMSEAFGAAGGWNADGSDIAEVTFRGQEYGPNAWRNLIPNRTLVAEYETVANGAAKNDPRNSYNFYRVGDTYNNGQSVLTATDVQGD